MKTLPRTQAWIPLWGSLMYVSSHCLELLMALGIKRISILFSQYLYRINPLLGRAVVVKVNIKYNTVQYKIVKGTRCR